MPYLGKTQDMDQNMWSGLKRPTFSRCMEDLGISLMWNWMTLIFLDNKEHTPTYINQLCINICYLTGGTWPLVSSVA